MTVPATATSVTAAPVTAAPATATPPFVPERVLVARLDSFGDVLLAGPAVRAVARHAAHVTLLCGPQGAAAARLLPGVDEAIVWRAPWEGVDPPEVDPAAFAAMTERLRAGRFDAALVLTSFHQSPLPTALLLRLAGVPRIGADSADAPGRLLDVRHRRAEGRHEAEAALDTAAAMGFTPDRWDDGRLRVVPPPDTAPLTGNGPYVVVHPGASAPARTWPVEHWRQAVEVLADAGHRVVVTGGPGERELTRAVSGDAAVDLGGRTDARTLAGVLLLADAVVVGNTGPAHLAAAVGTPVVSLFAPVVPAERWRPYAVPLVLLGDQQARCAGSRARNCPVAGHPCLTEVTAHDVLAAVRKIAEEAG
jgi:ADP-heptose:LPS heptosyltransferase